MINSNSQFYNDDKYNSKNSTCDKDFKSLYYKYKNKYLNLKKQFAGSALSEESKRTESNENFREEIVDNNPYLIMTANTFKFSDDAYITYSRKSEILLFSNGIIIKLVRFTSNNRVISQQINVHKLKNNSNMIDDFKRYINLSEQILTSLDHINTGYDPGPFNYAEQDYVEKMKESNEKVLKDINKKYILSEDESLLLNLKKYKEKFQGAMSEESFEEYLSLNQDRPNQQEFISSDEDEDFSDYDDGMSRETKYYFAKPYMIKGSLKSNIFLVGIDNDNDTTSLYLYFSKTDQLKKVNVSTKSNSISLNNSLFINELINEEVYEKEKAGMIVEKGNSLFKRKIGNHPNNRHTQILDKFMGKIDPGYSDELKYLLKRRTQLKETIKECCSDEKKELNKIELKLRKKYNF